MLRAAAYKATVCLRDPLDRGERAQLNLGHTFAHALEAASGFTLPHGRAVALGLLAALRLSGLKDEAKTVEEVLRPEPAEVDREAALAALDRDKKSEDGRLRLVLLDKPGEPRVGVEVDRESVRVGPRDADCLGRRGGGRRFRATGIRASGFWSAQSRVTRCGSSS